MNILFTINNAYAPWCGVTIESLFDNNKDLSLNVFILCNDLQMDNQEKLELIAKKYSRNINFLILTGEAFKELKRIEEGLKCGLNYNYFSRLVLDKFLPPDIDSILYLDTDIIINNSLKEIEDLKFDEKTAAYVIKDVVRQDDYSRLKINPDKHRYFNSGVMYINLKYWRKNNICDKALKYIIKYKTKIKFPDQDTFNFILAGKVKYLNSKYNCLLLFCASKKYLQNRVLSEDLHDVMEAARCPSIIHYVFLDKPWYKGPSIPYKKIWLFYFYQTPFKNINLKYRGGYKGAIKLYVKSFLSFIGIKRFKSIF